MPLPTRIGPGGPFLVSPPPPTAPALVDEESDAWWAGVNMCGASVPCASAAAALGLSVAIAGNFVQQDEVVPWLAGEVSSISATTQRAVITPTFTRWYAPDELPIVAVPLPIDDESGYREPITALAAASGILWATDEEFVPALPALEEPDWAPLVPPRVSLQLLQPWAPDDELSRGPAIEETYTFDLRAVPASIVAQPLMANEEIAVTVAVALDESEWLRYAVLSPAAQPLYLPDPDEAPAGALRGTADEDYWQPFAPLVVRTLAPLGMADDEIVPQLVATLDEVYEVRTERIALPSAQLVAWQADELPPASAGFLEETDWPVPPPVLVRPLSATWVDDERVPPPAPLSVEDEYCWVAGPYSARVVLGYVAVDEERVPPPPPLGVNEDYHWTTGTYGARAALSYDLTGADADLPTSVAVLASLARTYVVPVQTRLRIIALQARVRAIALQVRIRAILAQYRSK